VAAHCPMISVHEDVKAWQNTTYISPLNVLYSSLSVATLLFCWSLEAAEMETFPRPPF